MMESGTGAHTFNPSTWNAQAGVLWVQDQPGLQSESQDSQGYVQKLLSKKKKNLLMEF